MLYRKPTHRFGDVVGVRAAWEDEERERVKLILGRPKGSPGQNAGAGVLSRMVCPKAGTVPRGLTVGAPGAAEQRQGTR